MQNGDRNYAVEVRVPGAKIDLSDQLQPVWELMQNLQQQLHQVEQLCVDKVSHPELQRLSLEVQQLSCSVDRNSQKGQQQGNVVDKLQMDIQRLNASHESKWEQFEEIIRKKPSLEWVEKEMLRLERKDPFKDIQKVLAGKANQEDLQQLTAIVSTNDQEFHKFTSSLDNNWEHLQTLASSVEKHQTEVEQTHEKIEQSREKIERDHQKLEDAISVVSTRVDNNFQASQEEIDQVTSSLDQTKTDLQQAVAAMSSKAGLQELERMAEIQRAQAEALNDRVNRTEVQEVARAVEDIQKEVQELAEAMGHKLNHHIDHHLGVLDDKANQKEVQELSELVQRKVQEVENLTATMGDKALRHDALVSEVQNMQQQLKALSSSSELHQKDMNQIITDLTKIVKSKVTQQELQELQQKMESKATIDDVNRLTAIVDDKVNNPIMDMFRLTTEELSRTSQQGIELAQASQQGIETLSTSTAAALEATQGRLDKLTAAQHRDHQELEILAAAIDRNTCSFSKSSPTEVPVTMMQTCMSINQLGRSASSSPAPKALAVQPRRRRIQSPPPTASRLQYLNRSIVSPSNSGQLTATSSAWPCLVTSSGQLPPQAIVATGSGVISSAHAPVATGSGVISGAQAPPSAVPMSPTGPTSSGGQVQQPNLRVHERVPVASNEPLRLE